jgi:GMP reductase
MFVDNEVKLDYSDVLLVPKESALTTRAQIDLEVDHFDTKVIPIIAANMDGVGTFEMAKALGKYKIMTALIKHYSLEELVDFFTLEESAYAIYTMGTSDADYAKFAEFAARVESDSPNPIAVCVDVANGYSHHMENYIGKIRDAFPDIVLMVGSVVTPDRVETLIECGADIVKVGIGSGSVCTTRAITGVGYPQFSAVMECAAAAESAGGSIVADGGITCPGDAVKAFAAGAKYVMIGGLFAGHKEGLTDNLLAGEPVPFYGMASKEAQDKHNGGIADYRASEGKFVIVPYRGTINDTVKTLLGGIRSACTYLGCESIENLHRKAHFVKVSRQLNNIFS